VLLNPNALRNEEMHFLIQVILKIILFIVAPHYVLILLVNYWYKPRLAEMILQFND